MPLAVIAVKPAGLICTGVCFQQKNETVKRNHLAYVHYLDLLSGSAFFTVPFQGFRCRAQH